MKMAEEKAKFEKCSVAMVEKILPYVKEELQYHYPCNTDICPEACCNMDNAWIDKKQSWEVTHVIAKCLDTFYKPISEYVIKMKIIINPNMVPKMENIIHSTIGGRILKKDAYLMLRQHLSKYKYK